MIVCILESLFRERLFISGQFLIVVPLFKGRQVPFEERITVFDVERYRSQIETLCQHYQVKRLVMFGSALTDEFHASSDIDFLIEFHTAKGGLMRFMGIKHDLENLLGRQVDLVMPNAIRNSRIKEYIFSKTRELYAA